MRLLLFFTVLGVVSLHCGMIRACELCAIYNASSARGEADHGFVFAVSEQFTAYRTAQYQGKEVRPTKPDYLDTSITHLVPGYNFSARLGVSLNLPLTYRDFRRTDLLYRAGVPPPVPVSITERDNELALGDVAAIGRFTVFQKSEMKYGVVVNLLAGVKFPTGDAGRIRSEVDQARVFESLLPPNTPHDPLGHSLAGVHQHNLAAGSGSFDGVFGLTLNSRWDRWFLNVQGQYYLRTPGESGFRFGDELMLSGGPGGYVILDESLTVSLQANAVYDTMARDELLGRESNRSGSTAWYLGPQVTLTWGERFSANGGVDVPLRIGNHGYQNVPSYRAHAGVSWRF